MRFNRKNLTDLSAETLRIIAEGYYTTASGKCVEIGAPLANAIRDTCEYPPDRHFSVPEARVHDTFVCVRNESTMCGARRLVDLGHRVMALNFASAKRPGGGFRSGAVAQEETLVRSSGLYACLSGRRMYSYHKSQKNFLYSDYAIYSPDVPVFRDETGDLLEKPYVCSFISCPAVNAGQVSCRAPEKVFEIPVVMAVRAARILSIAAVHGHRHLVLGAWGCGVFRNDARKVAQIFRDALRGDFRGVFDTVVFSILDRKHGQQTFEVFQDAMKDWNPQ